MICISKQEKQSFVLNKEGRVASLTLTCQWVFLLTHLKASSDICLKIQCFHTIFLSSRCSSYPSCTLHAVPPIAISFFFIIIFPQYYTLMFPFSRLGGDFYLNHKTLWVSCSVCWFLLPLCLALQRAASFLWLLL